MAGRLCVRDVRSDLRVRPGGTVVHDGRALFVHTASVDADVITDRRRTFSGPGVLGEARRRVDDPHIDSRVEPLTRCRTRAGVERAGDPGFEIAGRWSGVVHRDGTAPVVTHQVDVVGQAHCGAPPGDRNPVDRHLVVGDGRGELDLDDHVEVVAAGEHPGAVGPREELLLPHAVVDAGAEAQV